MSAIAFIPIDLESTAELCICFRRDAMAESFAGGAERFDLASGDNHQQYLDWLQQRLQEFPEGCVHMLEGNSIVGQIEMQLTGQQSLAYLNMLYLVPAARGRGLGNQLHDYIIQIFQQVGVVKAQLSVSPTNQRALAFYKKHHWQDLGPRPEDPELHLMDLTVGDWA
ncbi:MAG: hypothetical protein DCF15_01155 [Phormidesmis priestleyi]|uniref:N-acetyltransferase domain-containing protein n=1 Tax=Phormidesmis priestleyi TaxID=268141 RepID=A0A2W4XWM6_9CYAN|nr:MAG: hypothetical protein DCF15_01155 [Phormidesmis priestleyi]